MQQHSGPVGVSKGNASIKCIGKQMIKAAEVVCLKKDIQLHVICVTVMGDTMVLYDLAEVTHVY